MDFDHVHECPECHERVTCSDSCDTVPDLGTHLGLPYGNHAVCDNCSSTVRDCERCHATMQIRDGDEPTAICDHCAHETVDELRAALTAAETRLAKAYAQLKTAQDENHRNANRAAHLGAAIQVIARHVGVELPDERGSGWANPIWEATKAMRAALTKAEADGKALRLALEDASAWFGGGDGDTEGDRVRRRMRAALSAAASPQSVASDERVG